MTKKKDEVPAVEATQETKPEVTYQHAFNGDSLAFAVEKGAKGTLVVEISGKTWGEAPLLSPLTVVRGAPLPETYSISFHVKS